MLNAVDVGGAQAELLLPGPEDDPVLAVDLLQLFGYVEGAVGAAVVDDDDLEVQVVLLGQVLDQQPDDDGQVLPLVVRWKEDGVLGHGEAER